MKLALVNCIVFFLLNTTPWHTNLNDALAVAKAEDKTILVVFSGSDWCKPCIQLKETVFTSKAFNAVADNYTLVNIDFKRDRSGVSKSQIEHNESVAEKYNPNGYFPFVVLINTKGEVLKSIDGYKGETAEFYVDSYLK